MYNSKLESRICSREVLEWEVLNQTFPNKTKIISFLNPFSYGLISSKPYLIDEVDVWFCDGALLCFLVNIKRYEKISRASFDFSSIAHVVFSYSIRESLTMYFIGGTVCEALEAEQNVKIAYPELKIIGFISGFFKSQSESEILKDIVMNNPQVVIVGLGTPLQEEFAIKLRRSMPLNSLIFTCGGFITQTSKSTFFYKNWSVKYFRWLQRALVYRHVRKRLMVDYPIFVLKYLFSKYWPFKVTN